MKRTTLVIMLLAILAVSCLVLTACDTPSDTTNDTPDHVCEFGEWTIVENSTCTELGQEQRVCACGEKEIRDIPLASHTYGDWTALSPATCTEDGLEIRYCGCGVTEIKDVEATGHSHSAVVTPPTCTERGFTTHTCVGCGDSYIDTYVEALGHNFQQSDTCEHCGQNIVDVAVKNYKHSYLDVKYYVVPRLDGKYDAYIKGTGFMPDNSNYGGFFYGESKIVSIYISDGITDIGEWAFNNCIGLTSIVIPDSVTTIGCCAFKDCINLTNIVIPDSVTRIDARAFWGCSGLTSIVISDSVTSISDYAFSGCSRLTSITIPEGVTSIGSYAFNNCSGLTSITFEEPYGWYVRYTYPAENTTRYLALNNASTNATYFTDTYCSYCWYKNN